MVYSQYYSSATRSNPIPAIIRVIMPNISMNLGAVYLYYYYCGSNEIYAVGKVVDVWDWERNSTDK